ncbi:UNVERIFIED_CONTAM: hypothetical protein Sindi_1854600 [Sesamum indicum]
MHAMLMWTVNDLPAYRLASGWSSTGAMRCPVCMEDAHSFYLQNSRKSCCFDYYRQFFHMDHPNRRNKKAFNKNRVERNVAQPRLMGEQIRKWVGEFSPAVQVSLSLADGRMNMMPKAVYTLTLDGPTLRLKKLREYLEVPTDNHNYNLHNPNGTQLVIELYVANQQGAGTSRSGKCKSYDESDDDSFDEDYETEKTKILIDI